jgi:hypothetical protein
VASPGKRMTRNIPKIRRKTKGCSPFNRLRAKGGVLKSYDFSLRAELVEL